MNRFSKGCALVCALALVFAVALPVQAQENVFSGPSELLVTYQQPSGEESAVLSLAPEDNGRWLWITIPDYFPLDALLLSYTPEAVGTLRLQALPGEIAPFPLDFTASWQTPYAFSVEDPYSSAVSWTGWLTVSHAERPMDLPLTPDAMPGPTEEPTEVPTEMPTQEPIEIPTEVPTEAPAETPIEAPTEIPTETPTEIPTETPTQAPTQIPTEVPTQPPTQVPTQVPTQSPTQIPTQPPTQSPTVTPTQPPLPTVSPFPTPWGTPPPAQTGYAIVTAYGAGLRIYPGGPVSAMLSSGNVLYVLGQQMDGENHLWHFVTSMASGASGYLRANQLRFMTEQEILAYLHPIIPTPSPSPTPRPTPAQTLSPQYSYAVVAKNSVNFRVSPGGAVLRTLRPGTLATLLSGEFWMDGYPWYRAQVGEEIGYLRGDVIDLVQLAPAWTPSPSPSPGPSPLPTARPKTLWDRILEAAHTPRLSAYAKVSPGAASYAVADFDSDNRVELLLAGIRQDFDGRFMLLLDAYAIQDGDVKPISRRTVYPLLSAGTQVQVWKALQDGRTLVYSEQSDLSTGVLRGQLALTLTEAGWTEVPLSPAAHGWTLLLKAQADALGQVTLNDLTGLDAQEQPDQPGKTGANGAAVSLLLRVLLELVRHKAPGNG